MVGVFSFSIMILRTMITSRLLSKFRSVDRLLKFNQRIILHDLFELKYSCHTC